MGSVSDKLHCTSAADMPRVGICIGALCTFSASRTETQHLRPHASLGILSIPEAAESPNPWIPYAIQTFGGAAPVLLVYMVNNLQAVPAGNSPVAAHQGTT